jgi:hypothetical protein
MARERSLKTPDSRFVIAAIASVAVSEGLRALMRALGAYTMVPPVTQLAYPSEWPSHLWYTARTISKMFGIVTPLSNPAMSGICIALSVMALLAVIYALVRTAVRWPQAERADQLLAVGALALFGAYTAYALATITNTHEIAEFVPVSAALAARAIPKGVAVLRPTAIAVATVTLVPLIAAAARPAAVSQYAPMMAWLEAHGQSYGISTYWLASSSTPSSSPTSATPRATSPPPTWSGSTARRDSPRSSAVARSWSIRSTCSTRSSNHCLPAAEGHAAVRRRP